MPLISRIKDPSKFTAEHLAHLYARAVYALGPQASQVDIFQSVLDALHSEGTVSADADSTTPPPQEPPPVGPF